MGGKFKSLDVDDASSLRLRIEGTVMEVKG
jgi:hypothetical protein